MHQKIPITYLTCNNKYTQTDTHYLDSIIGKINKKNTYFSHLKDSMCNKNQDTSKHKQKNMKTFVFDHLLKYEG